MTWATTRTLPSVGGTSWRTFAPIFRALTVTAAIFADAPAQSQPMPIVGRASVRPVARFNIEPWGGPLIVPVSTAPQTGARATFKMLLDTGANATVFDQRHRVSLGAPIDTVSAKTAGGNARVEKFDSPVMHLGDIRLAVRDGVYCSDMAPIADGFGVSLDGLIGMDVLRALKFRIDFDAGVLEFYDSIGVEFGRPVPLVWGDRASHDLPFAGADLGGAVTELFGLDTGLATTFAGALSAGAFEQLSRLGRAEASLSSQPIFTLRGTVSRPFYRTRTFSLAGWTHKNLTFVGLTNSSLGLAYLSRYNVTFDFPNSVMYLQPGKDFERPEADYASGLRTAREHGIVVVSVREGSPAETGRMREGDHVLAIDGRRTNEMSLAVFRRLIGTTDHHTLRVRRGDAEFDVKLGPEQEAPAQSAYGSDSTAAKWHLPRTRKRDRSGRSK